MPTARSHRWSAAPLAARNPRRRADAPRLWRGGAKTTAGRGLDAKVKNVQDDEDVAEEGDIYSKLGWDDDYDV